MNSLNTVHQRIRRYRRLGRYAISTLLVFLLYLHSALYANSDVSIAVLPFKNADKSDQYSYLNESIPATVITKLADLTTYKLLERSAIENVIRERKLESAKLSSADAREISKTLKADLYITGWYVALRDQDGLQINARIYETNSGAIIGSAQAIGSPEKNLFQVLNELSIQLAGKLNSAQRRKKNVDAQIDETSYPQSYNPRLSIFIGGNLGAGSLGTIEGGVYSSSIALHVGYGIYRTSGKQTIGRLVRISAGLCFMANRTLGFGLEASYAAYSSESSGPFSILALAIGPKYVISERLELFPYYSPQVALAPQVTAHKAGFAFRALFPDTR